ncbi:hypothetical protein [Chthonobacter rhizosphaerae]|uniref:type III secretion apparatus assembly protein SctX n=1 Tax=Chthonobacter rhizosphaerae TaxID=2735553 RepID=UPI0015EEA32B|nr:hypothetical protein [Chthonobacter rhizosphaerae]
MRIRPLDTGLEAITRWQAADEVHLPGQSAPRQGFLPDPRPLADILSRPTLDERLPMLLEPGALDPDLLSPAVLSAVRLATGAAFAEAALRADGAASAVLLEAARQLEADAALDRDVRDALALLLRG